MDTSTLLCPACSQSQFGQEYPFTVVDIQTQEDKELGQYRYALRCEYCGYATSFIGKPKE